MSAEPSPVEVVLVHRDPPCKKCLKTKAVVEEAMADAAVPVTFKEVFTGTPEAEQYGAVFSPMVLVAGKVASAGFIPLKAGLVKLIDGAHS
jgi:hypothetical protein